MFFLDQEAVEHLLNVGHYYKGFRPEANKHTNQAVIKIWTPSLSVLVEEPVLHVHY